MSILLTLAILVGFSDPAMPSGEKVVYLGYDAGNQTSREITHEVYNKGDYYYTVHTHHDTTQITVMCKVRMNDLSTIQIVKNRSGKFQLGIEQKHDAILVQDGFKDKETKHKHSGRFYDRHTLLDAFRGYPFDNPETVEFPFFESNIGMVITGECTLGGIYEVNTSIGKIKCYKLTLGFKSSFVQTAYKMILAGRSFDFYYQVVEPHRLIYWTDNKGSYIKFLRVESK
ncbi:hypothetical protein GF359_02250 [candidate division WOR-3 bacterium]|uniref:DUF3108 domain-containing protein n=1 Tax=candidate division WOR-3 bacterium TaxID=2052148 RepID=A0A9D5K9C9_UNCW3|nr:hypothetical protein [candidate division WOR-3 bacterium]MBD3364015.1 hypothetical protein [candidate division WOR-3 bacterium]